MPDEIRVTKRQGSGTSVARRLRRQGLVPGVVYGRGRATEAIAVEDRALRSLLSHHGRGLVSLKLDDSEPLAVLLKAVEWHPIYHVPLSVDFHAVSLTEKITTHVPVVLVGEPEGVTRGGILEHVLREVEVSCLPTQIPDELQVDVSSLEIGHSLHVRDLAPPAGAEILTAPEETLVLVAAPKVEEEKVEAVPAEGEALPEGEAPAEGAEAAPPAGAAEPPEKERGR